MRWTEIHESSIHLDGAHDRDIVLCNDTPRLAIDETVQCSIVLLIVL